MSATKHTIKIDTEVIAQLKGMSDVVAELQKGLKEGVTKVDLSKGMGASLSKSIAAFEKDYARIQKLTEGGVLQLGDTKDFTRKGQHLLGVFEDLQRIISNFDDMQLLDAKKLFPDAFDKKVSDLRASLVGLSDGFDKLATKGMNKQKLEREIKELEADIKTLQATASKEAEFKVSSDKAQTELKAASDKVAEIRESLKQEFKLKIDTDLASEKGLKEQLKTLKEQFNQTKNKVEVDPAGKRVTRYKGASAGEWRRKKESADKTEALAVLQQYEKEKQAIDELEKKIGELTARRQEMSKAAANIDTGDLTAAASALGKTDDEVKEVTDSLEKQKTATEQAARAANDLANAQKAAAAAGEKQTQLQAKQQKMAAILSEIDKITKQINLTGIITAFNKLNEELEQSGKSTIKFDLTEETLKSEKGVEQLKAELDKLDQADLENLKRKLRDIGFTANSTEDNVEGIKGAFDKIDDSRKTLTYAQRDMENLKDSFLRFFSITNTIQIFKNALKDAFNTVKELDAAMTETAVVTDFSIGDMWEKLPEYSKQATELGASIKELYNATTLYYQQGLNSQQAMDVGIETMKMARIAGMDAAAATEAMTAALRGFNMEINEVSATRINDVYSELAAITASDTEQIATAMSKTASIAASANMEFETTAALLAQIIETTQEAPETAGTAMKTIIARFTEVKELFSEGMLTGEDSEGEEININKIDAALKSVGISLKDFLTGTKGIDDIFLELASKWDSLDLATQRYIATAAAGSRQQSRFLAMMSNYGRTVELVTAANNSAGASQKQFDKTTESLEAKLQRLKNAWDTFVMGLANSDLIKGGVDLLTKLLDTINNLTDVGDGKLGDFITTISRLGIVLAGLKAGSNIFKGFLRYLQRAGITKILGLNMQDIGNIDLFGALFKGGKKPTEEVTGLIAKLKDPALKGGSLTKLGSSFGKVSSGASTATTAVGSFISAWGPWILLAAAIIAAIYGIYKAWQAASDSFKLEKLNESISQMTSNIEGAKQAIDDLKNSKSSLKTLQNEFSNLAKGTQEWKEKLIETNQQVLDLLDKYPELSSYITKTDFGTLDIKQEGWDALLNAQEKVLFNSTNAKIGLQYMRSDLQEKIDYETLLTQAVGRNFGESIDTKALGESIGVGLGTAVGGAGMGFLGSIAGPGGTAAGIAAGGLWGADAGGKLGAYLGAANEEAIQKGFASVAQWAAQAQLDTGGFLDSKWGKVVGTSVGMNLISLAPGAGTLAGAKLMYDMWNPDTSLEESAQRKLGSNYTQNEISELAMALGEAGITYNNGSFSASQDVIENILSDLSFETSFEQLATLAQNLGDSFNELTLSAQKYSLAKEGQRDGLMTSAISNSSIANKVYTEAVGNILGETIYENIEPKLNENKDNLSGKTARQLRELYASEVGGFYENGKLYSDATMSTQWDLSVETMKSAIASAQVAKEMGLSAEAMAKTLDLLSAEERQMFSELFSSDGTRISDQTYIDLLRDGSKASVDGAVTGDWLAQQMGFENLGQMAEKLGISVAEVGEILATNLNAARTRITNSRKATVGSMKKYGKQADSYNKHAQDLAKMEETYGPEFNDYLTNLFDKVTKTNDDALTSGVFAEFMEIAKSGDSSLLAEANSLINSIDWSNPIQAVSELQKKTKEGSDQVREMAAAILKAGKDAFSSGKQMQYFIQSESFEEVRESIQGIIETEGELTASNVLEMADDCADLKKILDQTQVSSAGLARALTGLETGELSVNQLTDAVLASLKSFNSLDSMVAELEKTLKEFDLGIDENFVSDTISSWYDIVKENMKKGAVGNSQIDSIYDFMFGENWDKNADGTFLSEADTYKRMQTYEAFLKSNSQDTYSAWNQLTKGENVYGEKFDKSLLGGLEINKNANGSIDLKGYEGMTSEEVAQKIADAYGVTHEAGKMLLTDFKNYSLDLRRELNANDFETAFEDSLQELNKVNQISWNTQDMSAWRSSSKSIIDESEIQAIAKMYGQDAEVLRQRYADQGVHITKFYDDEGQLLRGKEMIAELERTFTSESGMKNGAEWYAGFSKKVNGKTILDYDQMMSQLGKLTIPESAKVQMAEDIVESIRQGAASGETVYLDYEFSDGSTGTIEIPAGIDVATAIANAEKELENQKLGEAIAKAFGNVEVTVATDESNLNTEVTLKIETAVKNADTTVQPKVSETSIGQITNSVSNAIRSGSTSATATVYGDVSPIVAKVNSLDLSVDVTMNPVWGQDTGKPKAKGVKNSPVDEIALIGEEGAEIHQTATGAYLATGPQFAHIEKGDTVYTAEETKKILNASHVEVPRYATGFNPDWGYSSGSGGRSSDSKDETWENPFDKLYSVIRKIDEELRQRERIERRYEKLLIDLNTSAKKIVSVSLEELAQLERERILQEQMISGRRYQIEQYQAEHSDLARYANVVQNERGESVLRINWDLINQVTDEDKGARIEEYVSQMEEWFDSLQEAEEALWDIEDAVEEIKERGKDQYFDLENLIKDALAQSYQEEIDKLGEINNSINDTNSALLDAMQKSLDKQRQDRDNQRTENDLAEKQRRLLYLQQDTSGANAMEILQLQKEIEEGQEDYTDSLIDQKISALQEQNDEATKQREQQITLLQAQLDNYIKNGQIWQDVYGLMDEGLDKDSGLVRGSRLEELLKSTEGYAGMSEIAKMEWMNDTNNMIAQALAYLEVGRQLEDLGITSGEIEFTNAQGKTMKGTVDSEGNVIGSDGKLYNNVFQGADGKYYAGENIEEVQQPVVEGPMEGSGDYEDSTETYPYGKASETSGNIGLNASGKSVRAIQYALNKLGYENQGTSSLDGQYGYYTKQAVANFQRAMGISVDGIVGSETRSKFKAKGYKTGGLADYTGPAWLDGTKARPELVLNSRDTENFIQLKDILSSIMNRGNTFNRSTENNGDITYDIDINVESIGSDYDVDQVANRVKSLISENARYRNNNTVSLAR